MEISSLYTKKAHDAGAEMRVRGPDGKETDFYITLVGVDSSRWRKIRSDVEKRIFSGTELENGIAIFMADATLTWRGLVGDGAEIEFSKEKAVDLYINAPYICDQADRFIAKRVNFTMKSDKE